MNREGEFQILDFAPTKAPPSEPHDDGLALWYGVRNAVLAEIAVVGLGALVWWLV